MITLAELLDALHTASEAPEDAQTVAQMAEAMRVRGSTINTALRSLHKQGRVKAYRVPHVGVDGRRMTIPAYTILPKP